MNLQDAIEVLTHTLLNDFFSLFWLGQFYRSEPYIPKGQWPNIGSHSASIIQHSLALGLPAVILIIY